VAVEVKLKIKSLKTHREMVASALVNSDYEADTPQLLLPRRLTAELSPWPPPEDAQLVDFETAGGSIRVYLISNALEVSVEAGDRVAVPLKCDAVEIS